jgi:hypothetical protein
VALDERHRQPALRRIVGDREPLDPAADDQEVERAAGQLLEIARHLGHNRISFPLLL